MPFITDDSWVTNMGTSHDLLELSSHPIAVDASYYLKYLLDHPPAHEPLLPALGGLTGIADHIDEALEQWKTNNITPFFIFDGQPMAGQIEAEVLYGVAEHARLDQAWDLYTSQQAQNAVSAFGATSAFNVKDLYPLLMANLRKRGLHFLVAPYNASAQLAHFDIEESDQCAAIMGSQELLLYPIKDTFINTIDFANRKVYVISKPVILQRLAISRELLVDALLLLGTTFLPKFHMLRPMAPQFSALPDAVNLLRNHSKSVEILCNNFVETPSHDPQWHSRYQKARMAVHHFVYITESGQIKVDQFEQLTEDNREYLGLQLPPEVFHYINRGLISARTVDWIPWSIMMSLPNSTGILQEDYKQLLKSDLMQLREQVISVVLERLHRGFQHNPYEVRVWFDPEFVHTFKFNPTNSWIVSVDKFTLTDNIRRDIVPPMKCSAPLAYELLNMLDNGFTERTFTAGKKAPAPLKDAKTIRSLVILRFLHLRGYIDENHIIDPHWGTAIVMAYYQIAADLGPEDSQALGLFEAVFMAFELIRYGHFDAAMKYENLQGAPVNGSEEDNTSVLLICRCASLLNLRHQINGYTGPLNKNLLGWNTLVGEVRAANRSLVEALTLALFLKAQAVRDRTDYNEISQDLPFLHQPNVGMGIAMKTFLDETNPECSVEERRKHVEMVTQKWIPFATNIFGDLVMVYKFVEVINTSLGSMAGAVSEEAKERWSRAWGYLQTRPIQ